MSPAYNAMLWIAISFFCGSLPLSFWLGKIALGTDIRQYGDGNPGAANVWRAGGKWWGILAILLDGIKGLIPVACANFIVGVQGWALVAVTLAPMLGHAFSPFLGLRGGKSLAVTFGAWAGLTLAEIPLVLGVSFAFWLFLLSSESWAVMAGMLTTLVYILVRSPDPVWIGVWLGSFALLMWKHRDGFRKRPHLPRFGSSSRRKGTEGSLPGV
jgi:glycerol-3-phosphate acyltransferase PlsY